MKTIDVHSVKQVNDCIEVNSIAEIQELARQGFNDWRLLGDVRGVECERHGYLLLDYTPVAQYANRWNFIERVSRGLILSRNTGEVIARPYDKFFNWGEGGRFSFGQITDVSMKEDGSLGILYRLPDGSYSVATRGSFTTEQALWATEFLRKNYNLEGLPSEYTLLFEIVYPENRIVVDYKEREDLILTGVRNRFTGEELTETETREIAREYGFSSPKAFHFNSMEEIIQASKLLKHNEAEGWIVRFSDGQRFKVKGEDYLKVHRLIFGLSERRIVQMFYTGELEDVLEAIPPAKREKFNDIARNVALRFRRRMFELKLLHESVPKTETMKSYVEWVRTHHPVDSRLLIAMEAGKDIRAGVIQELFGVQVKHLTPDENLMV